MTKPQTTDNKTAQAQGSPSKYSAFYLALLILTTISVAFGIFGFVGIGTTLNYLKIAPAFAFISLLQYLITIVMAVALVLLYKKRETGLLLLISAYGLTVLCMIALPFAAQPLVGEIARQIVAEGKGQFSMALAEDICRTVYVVVAVIGALSSVTFATLWIFAWKKQIKKDSTPKETSE